MVAGVARRGDLVITMGAGDVTVLAPGDPAGAGAAGAGMNRPAPAAGWRPGRSAERPDAVRPLRPARRVSTESYRRRRLAAAADRAAAARRARLIGVRVLLYDAGLPTSRACRSPGPSRCRRPTSLAAAAVPPGGPLAAVDTGPWSHAGWRSCPPSSRCASARSWPHTVTVDGHRAGAGGHRADGAGLALVDRSGVVYPGAPPPGPAPADRPRRRPDDPATLAAVAVLAALPEALRPQVLTVERHRRGPGAPGQVTLGSPRTGGPLGRAGPGGGEGRGTQPCCSPSPASVYDVSQLPI